MEGPLEISFIAERCPSLNILNEITCFSEQSDDLLQDNDFEDIKLISKRMESLQSKISALGSDH